MAQLNEIAKRPGYEAAAANASKSTIVVFVSTFVYLIFFSGASPGFLGGALFFFVGIFAVSLVISMPLFLLRTKLPRVGLVVFATDVALTIFLTRLVYLWLFQQPVLASQPFLVQCREPIPQFSLGKNSRPNEAQVQRLCGCIWEKLSGWEKDTAQAIAEGREREVSSLNMAAFPPRFGSRVRECGGMDL